MNIGIFSNLPAVIKLNKWLSKKMQHKTRQTILLAYFWFFYITSLKKKEFFLKIQKFWGYVKARDNTMKRPLDSWIAGQNL